MAIEEFPPPPLLNPTTTDLLARISRLMSGGRMPTGMAMSPETWERLKAEPDQQYCTETEDQVRHFSRILVHLYEGALGVGIAYERH